VAFKQSDALGGGLDGGDAVGILFGSDVAQRVL
jgi:hypothetical protein